MWGDLHATQKQGCVQTQSSEHPWRLIAWDGLGELEQAASESVFSGKVPDVKEPAASTGSHTSSSCGLRPEVPWLPSPQQASDLLLTTEAAPPAYRVTLWHDEHHTMTKQRLRIRIHLV